MQLLRLLSLSCLVSLLAVACTKPAADGTTVSGQLEGAGDMQVFLDQLSGPGATTSTLDKVTADGSGSFTLNAPKGMSQGVYRIRVGTQKMPLVIDGYESNIEVSSSLDRIKRYDYTVNGSRSSHSLQNLLSKLSMRTYSVDDIGTYIDSVANPLAGVHAAELSLGSRGQYLPFHEKALARLKKELPEHSYVIPYNAFVNRTRSQYAASRANELVQIGQPAPDIKLTSPDGKEYSLSDLKGNIVLLDFWASWCGPCRRENPNVVRVYDKYNDDGFTVFSVSLDGVDSRMAARFQSQEQLDKQMEAQRNRWISAIDKDQLKWPYHVSDLKKWESYAAQSYGVRSIPKTFLIDREGLIAAVNPRGPLLEQELTKLL